MSARIRRLRAYTMIEMAVVMAVFGLLLAAFGRTLVTSTGLASSSRAVLMSSDDERRSLDAIAGELRGADYLSLAGFDPVSGVATAPTFQCAAGADKAGILLDAPETLSWRAVAATVDGVASPGEVVCTKSGATKVMAPHVASGGFSVTRTGNTLRITLTTFCSTSERQVSLSTATTYVSLRN